MEQAAIFQGIVLWSARSERRLIEAGYPISRGGFGVTLATNANRLFCSPINETNVLK
jgi:hypothetical protein